MNVIKFVWHAAALCWMPFRLWLKTQTSRVLPKSTLGQAIKYRRNHRDKLEVLLQDGRLELDNNRSERSIKPFVIGRKNWLFANTPRGARASAVHLEGGDYLTLSRVELAFRKRYLAQLNAVQVTILHKDFMTGIGWFSLRSIPGHWNKTTA